MENWSLKTLIVDWQKLDFCKKGERAILATVRYNELKSRMIESGKTR